MSIETLVEFSNRSGKNAASKPPYPRPAAVRPGAWPGFGIHQLHRRPCRGECGCADRSLFVVAVGGADILGHAVEDRTQQLRAGELLFNHDLLVGAVLRGDELAVEGFRRIVLRLR